MNLVRRTVRDASIGVWIIYHFDADGRIPNGSSDQIHSASSIWRHPGNG